LEYGQWGLEHDPRNEWEALMRLMVERLGRVHTQAGNWAAALSALSDLKIGLMRLTLIPIFI
jgi:hypothetical protein